MPAVRVMLSLLVRCTDRLAFATDDSFEMYRRYVGTAALAARARVFEALPSPCSCLSNGSLEPRPPQVLFVGGLIERKGVQQTMEAWDAFHARQPDATFRMVGKGRLEDQVVAWADGRPEVTVTIDPPRDEIHGVLRQSAVLLLLSQPHGYWREQIGLPILEGLSHGCEIVTTSETGLARWLAGHEHGVVAPAATADEVADSIAAALDRAAHRRGSLDDLPPTDQRFAADRWMMTGS